MSDYRCRRTHVVLHYRVKARELTRMHVRSTQRHVSQARGLEGAFHAGGIGRHEIQLLAALWRRIAVGRTQWHEHHAHRLAVALSGSFRFRTEAEGAWTTYEGGAIVPGRCSHQFEIDGAASLAHLFVEPETRAGRALTARFGSNAVAELCETATRPAEELDPRLSRALDYIRSNIRNTLSLGKVASAVALSESRFRHLFAAGTGSSFRAYLVWLRINLAIEAVMSGASWTEAAHEAGFADSAHLTRTHKRMFRFEPTAVHLQPTA